MATLRVNRATNTVASMRFLKMIALIAVGTVISTVVTGWTRDNLVDLNLPGGDAAYMLAAAGLVLAMPIKKSNAMYLAAGAGLGAVFSLTDEVGI